MLIGTILYHFHLAWLWLKVPRSEEIKILPLFPIDQYGIWWGLEAVKDEHPDTCTSWLLWVTISLVRNHRSARNINLCANDLTKIDLNGTWFAVVLCWTAFSFYFVCSEYEGENLCTAIYLWKKNKKGDMRSDIYQPTSFKQMMDAAELCSLISV